MGLRMPASSGPYPGLPRRELLHGFRHSSLGVLGNLATSFSKSLLDPRKYENFTVQVGAQTGPDGVLGGTLCQPDYDEFKQIVKDGNVKDASYTDMMKVYRSLTDAGLLTHEQVDASFFGSVEFNANGNQINADSKYNQWDSQHEQFPLYNAPDAAANRGAAINTFKLVAAIANALLATGDTVAERAFSPQERAAGASGASASFHLQLSDMAQRLSQGKKVQKLDAPPGTDIAKLIKQMGQAQRPTQAAQAAAASKDFG